MLSIRLSVKGSAIANPSYQVKVKNQSFKPNGSHGGKTMTRADETKTQSTQSTPATRRTRSFRDSLVPALLVVFSAPTLALAQLPLDGNSIGVLDGPNAVVLADLDRDGTLDALAASGPDGTGGEISFWTYDAISGWSGKTTIDASFASAKDIRAADLDGDGDLDVVAVSFEDDEVAWWENISGDASVWSTKRVIASSADGAVAVEIGDVDGDADLDVLACLRNSDGINWYENDGTPGLGGWVSHTVNAAVFSEATGVAVGDLDRDGDLDVAGVGRQANQLAWWENDGTPGDGTGGDGNSWTFHSIATGVNGARDVVLEDLDLDGDLDAAAAATTDDSLVWFENTADAASWSSAQAIGTIDAPRDLEAHDFDLDGDVDILAAGFDDDRVVWWENDLSGSGSWHEFEIENILDGARGVAAGDIDRDGDIDLLASGFLIDFVLWWENVPIHRSVEFAEDRVASDYARAAIAADIDRDGDLDVVGGGVLNWYERQGGSWQPHPVDTLAGLAGGTLTSVTVGDLDRDGDPDLAGTTLFHVLWWENDGTPGDDMGGGLGTSWTRHLVSEGHQQAEGISIADIDRDGFDDLVALEVSGGRVSWWLNDGTPADGTGGDGNSWTEGVIDSVTYLPRTAIVRDMDRDGDPDVVVTSQQHAPFGERISWWRNDGAGTVWTRQAVAPGSPISAAVGDIDGDGDLDVLSGESSGAGDGLLFFYEQQPPADGTQWAASSQAGTLTPGQPFVWETVLADLDSDGDLDAGVVGNRDSTFWYENPSAVSGWIRNEISSGQFTADSLVAQQADGRGGPDLVVASTSSRITIWENRSAQAKLIGSDASVTLLDDGEEAAVLRVNAISLGRTGDSGAEIARLDLLLEEAPGDPLSGPEASSVLAGLKLYEDFDGSGTFDPGTDVLIGSMPSPEPVDGVISFGLPDFPTPISHLDFSDYFLVVEMTADATAQATDSLQITLLTGRSRMEDANYDSPLVLQSPEDVSTQLMIIENALFRDDFESGDTTMWSVN